MRTLALLALLLGPAAGAPQAVRVTEVTAPEPIRIGDARVGQVYAGPFGELWMVLDAIGDPPDPSHWTYGVRPQPRRQYVTTTHTVPGYGTFSLQWPGPVYVADLRDGTLWLVGRDTWVRPAARWRVTAAVGGR